MPVEYFMHSQSQYPHENSALLQLARQMQRAFANTERFYLLATNVHFWQNQADAVILTSHSITLVELKACDVPITGRVTGAWHTTHDHAPVYGGSAENPYRQIVALRQNFIKYLDRNRRRYLDGDRVRTLKGQWGHVSGALVFTPQLHPNSNIIVPPSSRVWLGIIGLNEVVDFIYTQVSPQFDLRPQELRNLATEALGCQPWDIASLLMPTPCDGRLWLLDKMGQRAYAFAVLDGATIGRSRENTLIVPRRFSRTSRVHAVLRKQDGVLQLYDQHSTHGTFINGHKVLPGQGFPLHHGDHITLGDGETVNTCHLKYDTRASTLYTTDRTAITQ